MPDNNTFTIGLLSCASWRVNREVVLDIERKAAKQIARLAGDIGATVVGPGETATSEDETAAFLADLSQQKPDVLILHYVGWTEDQTVLKIVNSFQCPVMLWATDDVFVDGVSKLVAHVGYMEASAYLKKMGKSFFRLYGGPDEESDLELSAFFKAAKVLTELRRLKFGWIGQGYGSEGILDTTFDPEIIEKKLGLQFIKIPVEQVFDRYRKIKTSNDSAQIERLKLLGMDASKLREFLSDNESCVNESLRFLLALQDVVDEYELGALSIRCFPEFKQNDVPSPCLAVAVMNQNGISASCEGDVLSGVSMYLLSRLSGYPATIMDVFTCDQAQSTMDLFHCGSAAVSLAYPQSVAYRTHCKPANHKPGVTAEFQLQPGRVSFLKLDMLDKECRLFLHEGESITPPKPLRGTQATIHTDNPVKDLIEKLLDHGVSHHLVLSLGDVAREAGYMAKLAELDLVCL